ncbi:hypothetical protein [uncultured Fibrobacter sp.]|uniref:hypothetical protein n=1 Tax=uncultured Fibrobacter sp. TaxID=261512 RepID=UPI0026305707|nr:hypothetical protein [uncultured Fibrobacter sp.]
MSRRILKVALLMIASFFVAATVTACDSEEQNVPEMSQVQTSTPKSVPIVKVDAFTAPTSSEITADKARIYVKASAALVELGVRWSERIDNANETEKIQILNAYNVARDQLCARVGLAGIAEYNWITKVALPDPKNKAHFEAAGLKTNN